ncbi:MAG TPA: tRNA pseudouridine(55) synthase TruB [Thermodesulfovibrionales bacterium]|nr:tRNA pseudouridine(55) synthase TruB [Thermodesulfovibrionales bacterium]
MSERHSVICAEKERAPRLPSPANCIINFNKPKGITSHQAVEKIRRTLGVKKAGHAGTLDPLATGVLIICVGEGTKVARFLSDLDKEYVAVVKLGEKTNTFDSEGEVTEKREGFSCAKEDIEKTLPGFLGAIKQVPPMFSAVKQGGTPLYKLARKGITVERTQRAVTVHEIGITRFSLPYFEMRVVCSKGTYIRSLCNDIGEALGMGAHMAGLTRTRTGVFRIEHAMNMSDLEQSAQCTGPEVSAGKGAILSIDEALSHLRDISLTEREFRRAKNGLPSEYRNRSVVSEEYVRLKDPSGALFAIGKMTPGALRVERILHI